jgi:hypothetical protein
VLLKDSAELYRAKVEMNEKFKISKSQGLEPWEGQCTPEGV